MVKMSYYTDYSNYTDHHEVDEDITTGVIQGGRRDEQSLGGVTNRNISDYPSGISSYVASRCCTIQKKINITHLLTRVSDDKLHFHLY